MEIREDNESVVGGVDTNLFKYDLQVLLIAVWKKLYILMIAPLVTGALAFGFVAFYQQKTWTARCMLFRHTNIERLQSDMPNLYKPVETKVIIEMIRTRKNMQDVIKQLKLKSSIPGLYGQTAVEMQEENENIINILASANTPREAAAIANALAEIFIADYIENQNASIHKIYNYYTESKINLSQKIKALEAQQDEYLKRFNVISIATETEGKFKMLNELELNLVNSRMQESALRTRINNLEISIKDMKSDVQLNYTVTQSEDSELEKMQGALYKLRQRYTDDNPKVQKQVAEVEYLKEKMSKTKVEQRTPSSVTYGGNTVRMALEEQKFKAEAELKGISQNLGQLESTIKTLKSELTQLTKMDNDFFEIKRQLDLNRDLLKKIDGTVSMMKFALNTNVSDITILERAEPPTSPTVKKRRFFVFVGAFVGFVLAFGVILVFELMDFTIKSKFDIENVLKIKMLGSLPMINQVTLQSFYSSIQIVYKRIAEYVDKQSGVTLITFGDVETKSGKTFFIKKCIDLFGPQEKKILYISTVDELPRNMMKFAINDYIYKEEAINPNMPLENAHRLYFVMDDYTYIAPADKAAIDKFVSKLDGHYDYIFWELFEFNKNEQLFATICQAADLTVIVTMFKRANKFKLLKCVNFLKEHECRKLGGILNNVEKSYFNRSI
jgi:capsular polysaccharide biosynthesis protein